MVTVRIKQMRHRLATASTRSEHGTDMAIYTYIYTYTRTYIHTYTHRLATASTRSAHGMDMDI